MPPTSADTATAPRIRQYEQVQRRALLNPSVNFTRKRTVPQWHAASISSISFACIVKLPIVFVGVAKEPLARLRESRCVRRRRGLLAGSTWPALDDEWLAEPFRQRLTYQARDDLDYT